MLSPSLRLARFVAYYTEAITGCRGQAVAWEWPACRPGRVAAAGTAAKVSGFAIDASISAPMRSATSGIFDLEPIALNYLNEKLSLDQTEIATLSPLRTLPERGPPLHLAVGGAELPELKRQSQEFADAARARGLPVRLTVLPGLHHFSILDEIARPDGALTRELADLVATTK